MNRRRVSQARLHHWAALWTFGALSAAGASWTFLAADETTVLRLPLSSRLTAQPPGATLRLSGQSFVPPPLATDASPAAATELVADDFTAEESPVTAERSATSTADREIPPTRSVIRLPTTSTTPAATAPAATTPTATTPAATTPAATTPAATTPAATTPAATTPAATTPAATTPAATTPAAAAPAATATTPTATTPTATTPTATTPTATTPTATTPAATTPAATTPAATAPAAAAAPSAAAAASAKPMRLPPVESTDMPAYGAFERPPVRFGQETTSAPASDSNRWVNGPRSAPPAPLRLPPISVERESPSVMKGPTPQPAEAMYSESAPSRWHRFKSQAQYDFWGYPQYFCERPFGLPNQMAYQSMVDNAREDLLVFHQYDFHDGHVESAASLNAAGLRRVERVAALVARQTGGSTVIVEFVPDQPRLSEARREEVAAQLGRFGLHEPTVRVGVGRARRGLTGREAEGIQRTYDRMTGATGLSGASSAAGGASGMGGAGGGLNSGMNSGMGASGMGNAGMGGMNGGQGMGAMGGGNGFPSGSGY